MYTSGVMDKNKLDTMDRIELEIKELRRVVRELTNNAVLDRQISEETSREIFARIEELEGGEEK